MWGVDFTRINSSEAKVGQPIVLVVRKLPCLSSSTFLTQHLEVHNPHVAIALYLHLPKEYYTHLVYILAQNCLTSA